MDKVISVSYTQNLYKHDSKGKIRILEIYAEGVELVQKSGLLGGAMVTHRKTCTIKNAGRANEVNAYEQAILEAKSKVEEKLTTGYFKTLKELESGDTEVIMPMLAKSYEDEKDKINWEFPVFIQPKLDGQRTLAIVRKGVVKLMSRQGKEITTLDHIKKAIEKCVTKDSNFVCDGEAYSKSRNFQENMRLIKKVRPETTEIHYHMYDVIENSSYIVRKKTVEELVSGFNSPYIELVVSTPISSRLLARAHAKNIGEGYEGSIIRHSAAIYEVNHRSSSLLKYKDFLDLDAEIIDVIPMDAYPEQGIVVCKYKGLTFKATPKMSHSERAELLKYKKDIIGK